MTSPKLPQHANPTSNRRVSQAPYNFVPLPERVLAVEEQDLPKHDRFYSDRLTGWLDLAITTETPLYIRCGPSPDQVKHKEEENDARNNPARRQFFHHGDQDYPVIPGSSLRGMTRSLVEILAYAKLQWFSNKKLVYRAVGDPSSLGIGYRKRLTPSRPKGGLDYPSPSVRAGYLRHDGDGHYIQPAQEIKGESFVHVEYGLGGVAQRGEKEEYGDGDVVPVYIKPPPGRKSWPRQSGSPFLWGAYVINAADVVRQGPGVACPKGFSPAVIVRSGHMRGRRDRQTNQERGQKHFHCAIYSPDERVTRLRIGDDLWRLYRDDREISRGIPSRPLEKDGDPLFYLVDDKGKLVFFGPTMMFRLPYQHRLQEFIPNNLQTTDDGKIDLAEAIFGTVDRKPAIKGRVFFHDAPWDRKGGSPFLKEGDGIIVPNILSNPKPTSFQHYLAQPSVQPEPRGSAPVPAADTDRGHGLLTWDHPYFNGSLYELEVMELNKLVPRWRTGGTVIRGHKLYWHKPGADTKVIESDPAQVRWNPNGAGLQSKRTDGQWGKDTQHTVIRPVGPVVTFCGRVSFENLSPLELGALLAALELPPTMRHHLGMGKPLGMGSVRIQTTLHLTERTQRYARLLDDDGLVNLGELAADQVEAKGSAAKEAFRAAVIAHVKATEEAGAPADADLWDVPRLKALAALLKWDAPPARDVTAYVPALYKGQGNREIQWWRERRVLPTPEGVLQGPAPDFSQQAPTAQRRGSYPSLPQTDARPVSKSQRPPSPRPPTPGEKHDEGRRPVLFAASPGPVNVQTGIDTTPTQQEPDQQGFTGQRREIVTLTTDVRNGKARVRVGRVEVDCSGFGGGNLLKTGEKCRADVSYQNGAPVSAKFKGRVRG